MNPWLVRNAILPVHERLRRRSTFGLWRELQRSQWHPQWRVDDLRLTKLRELVGVALTQTACYGDLANLPPSWRPTTLEDLAQLPLLDKQTISDHREGLTNWAVPGGAIRYRTGGSSGVPLIFYIDRRRQSWDRAARIRAHEWWGVLPGDREAHVWNSPVELAAADRLKRFRDRLTNERLLPASDLSPETVRGFVHALRRFRPHCVFGYPSALTLLSTLATDAKLRLDTLPVQVVFCTAEVLYEHQKRIISEVFGGAPVANNYGSREAGFIAHECPEGRMHVTSENVIVEILRDGQPVERGQTGEIVVTQLDNHAMPFLRYRTGDIGALAPDLCPCGRGLEVMQVVKGRSNDFLIAPDGRWVHGSAVHAVLSGIPGIRTFQLRQDRDHHVRVLLVKDGSFPPEGEERIRRGLLQRLGRGASVSVEPRDEIPPGESGKFRYIISELSTLTHWTEA